MKKKKKRKTRKNGDVPITLASYAARGLLLCGSKPMIDSAGAPLSSEYTGILTHLGGLLVTEAQHFAIRQTKQFEELCLIVEEELYPTKAEGDTLKCYLPFEVTAFSVVREDGQGMVMLAIDRDEDDMATLHILKKSVGETWFPLPYFARYRKVGNPLGYWEGLLYPGVPQPYVNNVGEAALELLPSLCERLLALNHLINDSSRISVVPSGTRPPTENRSRLQRGKLPLFETRTLTIRPEGGREARVVYPHQGGTHTSPREHDRRGHFRAYKSGKVVWVRAAKVNPGGPGRIDKIYEVKL